ncbi:MAG: type II secretion system GspH family protein [Verrucomicrobia bacterium]|jgi:prepilin-type N-terminal cleavage/methylation domain-containing protein|nr:type II secretion system GspH family protein [Verrucomicrobiota bacterium]
MKLVRKRGGFTLVEIMIVVAIIGLLSTMAIPSFVRARENSREKMCVNNLRQLDGAKDVAALENGIGRGGDVSPFVELYLKNGVPVCPEGNTGYELNLVGEPPRCQSPLADDHNTAYGLDP